MYDIYVFMQVCIYHKHMYVCMNHAYVCLIVLFLLSLSHTHTHTYHTVCFRIRSQCLTYHTKYAKYESTCSAIWSRPRSHFRPCLASYSISENFARKQVFFFVFRLHSHTPTPPHVFLILRVRHESSCHASRQI